MKCGIVVAQRGKLGVIRAVNYQNVKLNKCTFKAKN